MRIKKMSSKYICPRCDYSTTRKNDINRHFQRKITCPAAKLDIALTSEVIQKVLKEYIYTPPPNYPTTSTMVQSEPLLPLVNIPESSSIITRNDQANIANCNFQINNNQNIVNINNNQKININKLVIQGDCIDNLQVYLKYRELKLTGVEDTLESRFKKENVLLQEARFDHLGLSKHCLLDRVSKTVEAQFPEEFNIVHQTNPNKILIYHNGEWETYLEESGVYRVIKFLRSNLLDEYELYLLKKLHQGICKHELAFVENLETYYKFLTAFELTPDVEKSTDTFLIGHNLKEDTDYVLSDYAVKIFQNIKAKMTKADRSKIYKSVLDIIKGSSASSIHKLNCAMMEILRIDQEFRHLITNKSETWGSILLNRPTSIPQITEL